MRYVSIDLETTGLDWDNDQILEVGVVLDDLQNPIPLDQLPTLRLLVCHDRIEGNPFALAMNAHLIKEIADRDVYSGFGVKYTGTTASGSITPQAIGYTIRKFLKLNGYIEEGDRITITVAGKNVSGDLRALDKTGWGKHIKARSRLQDPGSMLSLASDDVPPGLGECLARAGYNKSVTHKAVEDAMDVVRCIRYAKLGIRGDA